MAALCFLVLLLLPENACAWGPISHVYFASQALDTLAALGIPLAEVLVRYRTSFLFGSVAADMTIGKSFADQETHCHNWSVAFGLLDAAEDDPQHAFMWGYLCHLAADTVAHNYFVPYHLVAHADRRAMAHAYWEIRADALIAEPYWQRLAEIRAGDHRDSERLMAGGLAPTLFSHRVNRHLFHGMMRVVCQRRWRRTINRVAARDRWDITPIVLHPYQRSALSHTVELLRHGRGARCVQELDPTGYAALTRAEQVRKRLRCEKRRADFAADRPGELLRVGVGRDGHALHGYRLPSHGSPARCHAIEPPSTLTAAG
jgi:hypothetical protein